ncbi:cupin domain-containing protein [Zeaxanthinibacter enoshimensis]|uniref:Cupin domain-containing protein n=1 Tax=Zeaxanthinibacter enoshimensis TaxID=392009 RepID=A0A4R6TGK2_9FLAO|nr:cupin domain-containing protein [Zeaxanthinibacter enoshimensis]TDQ28973.1 Cupin domain-containing protein [Zeaxanthinibacter enoshimensis]
MDIKLSEVPSKEIMPGFHGKLIHTEKMTLAYWEVEEGAEVPEHSHMHEQIMQVLEGRFEFTLDGQTKVYEPGQIVPIPSHIPHSGKALTRCRLMDIFSPAREEYK